MKRKIPFTNWYLYKPETSTERGKRRQKKKGACNVCGKIVDEREAKTERRQQAIEDAKMKCIYCLGCDRRVKKKAGHHKRCKSCQGKHRKEEYKLYMIRKKKAEICEHCGEDYFNHNGRFCKNDCYKEFRKLCKNT